MSRYAFNLLVMVIIGLITLLVGVGAAKFGLPVSLEQSMVAAFFASVVTWILLEPAVFQKLKYICNELDWADESVRLYHAVPVKYRQSFWLLFAFINVAFLFNTINFMWGNEDWGAVRFAVDHNESLSAGSFSAYWLQELLFDGKILPVINNLWCFGGLLEFAATGNTYRLYRSVICGYAVYTCRALFCKNLTRGVVCAGVGLNRSFNCR